MAYSYVLVKLHKITEHSKPWITKDIAQQLEKMRSARKKMRYRRSAANVENFRQLEWPLTQISRSRYNSASNNSKMVQDRTIFTMADRYKVTYGLSNGAIFNDLDRPLTWFSRSRHSLTLNISQMATDTANRKPHPSFRMAPISRSRHFQWPKTTPK